MHPYMGNYEGWSSNVPLYGQLWSSEALMYPYMNNYVVVKH